MESTPNLLVEQECMGERKVYIHLLVPTQFGIHKNEISYEGKHCCICNGPLHPGRGSVFQIVLRVIGGTGDGESWEYATALDIVCKSCRSYNLRRYSLLMLRVSDFDAIYRFIDQYAFSDRTIEVENFLAGPTTSHSAVFNALVDSYLYRLNLLDAETAILCRTLRGANCFFCQTSEQPLVQCLQCKCVSVCNSSKCSYLIKTHHISLCKELQRGRLFHADVTQGDCVWYIERTLEGRCLVYSPNDDGSQDKNDSLCTGEKGSP